MNGTTGLIMPMPVRFIKPVMRINQRVKRLTFRTGDSMSSLISVPVKR
jgi:hypothetical protein